MLFAEHFFSQKHSYRYVTNDIYLLGIPSNKNIAPQESNGPPLMPLLKNKGEGPRYKIMPLMTIF